MLYRLYVKNIYIYIITASDGAFPELWSPWAFSQLGEPSVSDNSVKFDNPESSAAGLSMS
jgi:hypothetical protein